MKKILMLLIGLSCASGANVPALATPAQTLPAFGNLPLYFTAAFSGGANHPAEFVAHGSDYQFSISPAEARLALQKPGAARNGKSPQMMRMQFVDASAKAQIEGMDELPGKVNYLIGNNPSNWRAGVATYARLRIEQLYPGINLVYYGNQRQLEYDLTVEPGANPDWVQIHFAGVDKISIGKQGELILSLGGNEIRQPAPVIYQMLPGRRQTVSGGYRLLDGHTVAFTVGKYDHHLPLVIDPVLSFSTYFGGNSGETAWSVALDAGGSIYIAGNTLSSQFPTNSRPSGYQTNFAGGGVTGDAFVAKFGNQGSNLIYFTFLGGSADDQANSIAVDSNGDAFITGFTDSANFPTTTNALNRSIGGPFLGGSYFVDAYVAELNPGGSNLVYSTYLGGSGPDSGNGIALDSSNNIYVTGFTCSTNFPTTTNAFRRYLACPFSIYTTYLYENAFVTEIGASKTNLLYSSYLGGTNFDVGKAITVDSSNYVYVAGLSSSTNFPTANFINQSFYQTNGSGTNQVVITNVVNGSLLNGSTGQTVENQSTPYDGFVAKFAPGCTSVIYSTFLGGTNSDAANSIAVDGSGNAYVTGWTISTNFPNTASVSNLYNGLTNNLVYGYGITTNVFLTEITNAIGANAGIGFSAVFGGTNFGGDIGNGITLDTNGNIFIVGSSTSTNFPAVNTPGMMGSTNAGGSDAFVIALSTSTGTNGTSLSNIIYSGYLGGSGNDFGCGIAVDSSTNVYIVGQTTSANFPTLFPQQSTLNGPSDAFLAKIGLVNDAPAFTEQPTNQAVVAGTSVSFVAAVTGTPPLTYQWQQVVTNIGGTNLVWTNVVNHGNISGANNTNLVISSAQTTNSGTYRLFVANTAGSITSSNADLTVTNVLPTITTQPTNQIAGVGGDSQGYASFSASVSGGTSPVTYQWVKDGTNLVNGGTNFPGALYPDHIYGATSTTLYVVDPHANDEGTYWLVITNPAGVVKSSNATLTVTEAPVITGLPTNQMVGQGSMVSIVVKAVGAQPLSYQWQHDGANLMDGLHIGGSTTNTMTITNAQTGDNGSYLVIVTNSFGAATSSPPAVLTVLTVPTFLGITATTNGGFIFSGNGGTNSGSFVVLASTNLALPLNQWTTINNVGNFGSQGQFIFTNTPPPNLPQRFYLLEIPSN